MQRIQLHTVSTRACTECARSRERCTRTDPCQRCLAKGFRCIYPQPRASVRTQQSASNSDQDPTFQCSLAPEPRVLALNHGLPAQDASSDRSMLSFPASDAPSAPSIFTPYQQPPAFGAAQYYENQSAQQTMDFPMNWLPPDNSIAIDYDSIVGWGIGSLDYFSFPDSSTDVAATNTTNPEASAENEPLSINSIQNRTSAPRDTQAPSTGDHGTPWSAFVPDAVDHTVSSGSPHSSKHTVSPSAAPGGLYATSFNGARMPCTVRGRRANRLLPGATPIQPVGSLRPQTHSSTEALEFPDTSHILLNDQDSSDEAGSFTTVLTETAYAEMQHHFSKLCLGNDTIFSSYASSRYPGLSTLNMFVQLYLDNFDPILPILHDQVVQIANHWLLALAVCAIGCQYAEADEFSKMVEPLHEFLRRAIAVEYMNCNLQDIGKTGSGIALAQAMTLSQVGMLYSGSRQLLQHAKAQHGALVSMARNLALQNPTSGPVATFLQFGGDRHASAWSKIISEECKRRIGYAVWLLDCMAVYHFQQQPSMPSHLAPVPLPNDKIWQLRSASDWAAQSATIQETPSLASATISLFREKQIVGNLGQFSHVILLHGVFREIFQLKDCFARPLGNWIPSIQQAARDNEDIPNMSAGPGPWSEELLSSWRNAALDCVDVLHWAANGTIARQAGTEHPAVFHLHFSRTVLLAPFNRFQTLAESIVSFTVDPASRARHTSSRQQAIEAERDILEWAQRDQCKARLAVLHSGCLFWHVRRYSTRAFYEPIAIFLATLTIWAYSSYASRTSPSSQDRIRSAGDTQDAGSEMHSGDDPQDALDARSPSDSDFGPVPTFIHLDRPNDDEMVQFFVRFGTAANMKANVAGVGDIYSTKGPARILREGRKILAAVSTAWGRSEKMSSLLAMLEQIASGRMTPASAAE